MNQLKIIDSSFINKINPLPFGKKYSSEDVYFLIEYNSKKLCLSTFKKDKSLNLYLEYNIIEKSENKVVFNNCDKKYDYISQFNYQNIDISMSINIFDCSLIFSFNDKTSGKENIICILNIEQINFGVPKLIN